MGLIWERRWTSLRLDFLEKLDDLAARLVDNAAFFQMSGLSTPSDDEIPDLMMTGFPSWIMAARAARVLP